jgi:hypothetical protein
VLPYVSDSAHPSMPKTVPKRADSGSKDLMISYSHADKDMMLKVRGNWDHNVTSIFEKLTVLRTYIFFAVTYAFNLLKILITYTAYYNYITYI